MEKKPFVTLEQVRKITETYPTPFHIYDEHAIRENARKIKKAFAWNPGFQEYFAVKATPTPRLIQILHEEGFGCDCSSYTELLMSKACGVRGHEIMFSSNVTPDEDFRLASQLDAIINFDDITHLEYYDRVGEWKETMSCRFNPGGDFVLENEIMDTPQEAKYGMTREQLVEAFKIMKSKGVKHFGIHAFLASNTVAEEYYPALSRILFKLAVSVQKETGVHIAFINLSGGVGIPYKPWQEPNDIEAIGEGVHRAFDEILVPAGMEDVAIYTEMGRFVLGPYGALVARCIHHKHTYKEYVGLDACAANLMRPAMYNAYHHITVLGKENALHDRTYDVTGGLCENNDKFAVDRNLPRIDIGDYIYIHDTGAHGFSMGYNYNGKLRSAELLLCEDGKIEMIRRAETPKDYFATFDFTHLFDGIDKEDTMGLFHKKKKQVTIQCPVSGEIIPAAEIEDETFSTGMLGFTIGIRPTEGIVYAPADGTVTTLYDALHAVAITTPEGVEVLVHVGIDTVSLQGEHFTSHTKEGAEVKAGDILLGFDIPAIQAAGYPITTSVIITNTPELGEIKAENGKKTHGDSMITVHLK